MNAFTLLVTLVLATSAAAFATPLVARLATHVGMVDEAGDRRMHALPTPRIGGVALFLGFSFALFGVVGYLIANHKLLDLDSIHDVLGLLFGGTLILMVGLWDDIMGMRPRTKFFAQFVVAAISLLYGFDIKGFDNPLHRGDYIHFPYALGAVFTLLWYLGMMNAINFIDGLDGLLAGLTAISGMSLLVIEMTHGHPELALVLAALVGGALGFLPFNFNPAKIFLGDCGALFIGYVFATVSIIGVSKFLLSINLVIPLVVLALPILDTAVTIVRRTWAGKKITEADRGHFHHQLIFRFGLNVRQAVLLIYVVCIALGAVALLLSKGVGPIKLADSTASNSARWGAAGRASFVCPATPGGLLTRPSTAGSPADLSVCSRICCVRPSAEPQGVPSEAEGTHPVVACRAKPDMLLAGIEETADN